MSDNHFFAEQELCNSRLNDRIVDQVRKKREPRSWNSKPAPKQVTAVVVKKGIVARVTTEAAASDATAGLEAVAAGAEHLAECSAEERRRLLEARRRPYLPWLVSQLLTPFPPPGSWCLLLRRRRARCLRRRACTRRHPRASSARRLESAVDSRPQKRAAAVGAGRRSIDRCSRSATTTNFTIKAAMAIHLLAGRRMTRKGLHTSARGSTPGRRVRVSQSIYT